MIKDLLSEALRLSALGFHIIPVDIDKKPTIQWQKYQTIKPSEVELNEWLTSKRVTGIAVITGERSGIIALDLDAKHNRSIKELGFKMPLTASVKSGGGGEHYYFKHPGFKVKTTSGELYGPGIDIRGDGGYIILPPSLHKSGNIYEWFIKLESVDDLADMPVVLRERINPNNEGNFAYEGERNSTAAKIIGSIIKKLHPYDYEKIAWPKVVEWNNAICKPPLEEKELRTTFDSICGIDASKKRESNGYQNTKEIELGAPLSIKDLLEKKFNEPLWAIESLFERGTLNMISAAPNQYKTWITYHFALNLAKGGDVFGKFKTIKQKVLIINEEDTERMTKDRIEKLSGGFVDDDNIIFFYLNTGIRIKDDYVSKIIEKIHEIGAEFIIFDSLRAMHDADENSSAEIQKVMDGLKRIYNSAPGTTILFTHHNKKRGFAVKEASVDDARGSSAINAAIHGHIAIEESSDKKHIIVHQHKLKCDKKLSPFMLKIVDSPAELGSNKKESMDFIYDSEYEPHNKEDEKDGLVLDYIKAQAVVTVADIAKFLEYSEKSVRGRLRKLLNMGLIEVKTKKDLLNNGIAVPEGASVLQLYYTASK